MANSDPQDTRSIESEQNARTPNEMLNAMAGRISALDVSDAGQKDALAMTLSEAISSALNSGGIAPLNTSPANDFFQADPELSDSFDAWITSGDSTVGSTIVCDESVAAMLFPSSDQAVEAAICFARRRGVSGSFKIVSLIGSDHGRTAACRTASGIPELHDGYGPLVAGFTHVPPDNIDALKVAIDDSTAAVLLAPVDFGAGAIPLTNEFLTMARELCDQHDALLIIDEQMMCIGAAGSPFAFSAITDGNIPADAVITSSGLFVGHSGAALVAGTKILSNAGRQISDPILSVPRAAAIETLRQMTEQGITRRAIEIGPVFAKRLAEAIGEFSFVRDLSVCGLTIGIQTDLPADEMVDMAFRNGLLMEPAGETAVVIQPSPSVTESDQVKLIERFTQVMQAMESRTATAMVGQSESEADDSEVEEGNEEESE